MLGGMDEVEGEALEGAEFEAEAFGAALLGREGFEVGGGEFAVLKTGDVGGGIADVLPAVACDGAGAAGAEAEVVLAAPVGGVVTGGVAGAGVVRDFVVGVAGGFEEVEGGEEEVGVLVGEFAVLAAGEAVEEFGVFFVVEVVGGDVVRGEVDGAMEGFFPGVEGLTRDGEHQVEVEAVEAGLAEGGEGGGSFGGGVVAAEGGEGGGVPGLDAEADAGDAVGAEEFGFGRGDGAGVGFEGELGELGAVDEVFEAGEEVVEMGFAEEGGGAATEVEGVGLEVEAGGLESGFSEESVDEGGHVGAARGVFEERAVGADAVTEGDVDVAVAEGRHDWSVEL